MHWERTKIEKYIVHYHRNHIYLTDVEGNGLETREYDVRPNYALDGPKFKPFKDNLTELQNADPDYAKGRIDMQASGWYKHGGEGKQFISLNINCKNDIDDEFNVNNQADWGQPKIDTETNTYTYEINVYARWEHPIMLQFYSNPPENSYISDMPLYSTFVYESELKRNWKDNPNEILYGIPNAKLYAFFGGNGDPSMPSGPLGNGTGIISENDCKAIWYIPDNLQIETDENGNVLWYEHEVKEENEKPVNNVLTYEKLCSMFDRNNDMNPDYQNPNSFEIVMSEINIRVYAQYKTK